LEFRTKEQNDKRLISVPVLTRCTVAVKP